VTVDLGTAPRLRTARPRADATRNRERIVSAAREALVECGPEVPLDEVARRAGVGNATLYRHFTDRAELVRQVTPTVMENATRRAEEALAEAPDAFSALCRFVFEASQERMGALSPLLSDVLNRQDPAVMEQTERLTRAIDAIIDLGRRSGQVRPDIAVGDVVIALTQLSRPLPGTGCAGFDPFVQRHLQLFLDGLRAPARSVLVGTAATLEELRNSQ
jgi:AcrR family transcriptional regulator